MTTDIVLNGQSARSRGVVVAYVSDQQVHASEHERITQAEFARRLAALKDYEAGGLYDPRRHCPGHIYFVPGSTLTTEQAAALGIRGPHDLFGGVVPHAFVATKVISHPLVEPAAALPGWNRAFGAQVGDAVLAGYAAFNHDDARRAGLRLLESGPVRIKPVLATGGLGQSVARDAAELQRGLESIDPSEVTSHGLVLEENLLSEVRTFSVGQVKVGDLTASYFGHQRLTRNNRGAEVYGGSDLTVVRGDFDALLGQDIPPEIRCAIGQAQRYNAAVIACYPGFFASRNNYDIVLGRDAAGRPRSGVLEQSWRLGGATGAELAALEVFRNQPDRNRVRASSIEVFGQSPPPPAHATVYFRGNDPRAGRLTKYTVVEPDVYP